MNIRRVKALAVKEFIQIARDPRSLGLAIALPIFLLFIFGYALTLDVNNVPMAVWNQDKSQVSTDFIRDFKDSRYFNIIRYADNYSQIEEYIDSGDIMMALVIHKDFSDDIRAGRKARVQLIVDGSDSNTATISMGYVNSVVSEYDLDLMNDKLSSIGVKVVQPVDVRPRVWFNADLKSRNFIIPGLIAIILTVISALITSLTVAKEWERGTMEQLISTPVRSEEIIMGKFLPYFAIGFLDLLISLAVGQFVFAVPFRGSLILLFAFSGLFLTGTLMLGIMVSVVMKSQLLASQVAVIITFIPAFILSGFMYPIANMPPVIQAITYIVPARYFITILKGIYLKGVGIEVLWSQGLFLFLYAGIMMLRANRNFKKKVA